MNNLEQKVESMEKEILDQRAVIDAIYVSTEKTRKYFLWTLIGTAIVFILPLIGLMAVIPSFLSLYGGLLGGL